MPDPGAPATLTPPPPGPVPDADRIHALDVLRGFALLGILFVNITVFGEPLAKILGLSPPDDEGPADGVAFYFVKTFCEGKFYLLFSMLFGMGLVVQMTRARAAGKSNRRFRLIYLRRQLFLIGLGLLHGVLLWFGDILFLYGCTGLLLLLCSRARPRTLAIVAAVLLTCTALITSLLGVAAVLLDVGAPPQAAVAPAATPSTDAPSAQAPPPSPAPPVADPPTPLPAAPATPPRAGPTTAPDRPGPVRRLFNAYRDAYQSATKDDPRLKDLVEHNESSRLWMDLETEAFRDGPFLAATAFRAWLVACVLIFYFTGFGWSAIAMFFLGAAMMKWGIFLGTQPPPAQADDTQVPGTDANAPIIERRRRWYRRFVWIGLLIGFPLNALGAAAAAIFPLPVALLIVASVSYLGAFALMLGYFGAVCLLVASGRLRRITDTLARAGRMALSNYLLQTVLATAVFYHWGLAQFGNTTTTERVGLVLAIYALNLIFSTVWLRRFRMGPMEWLWRSATYWRWQPLVR